MCISLNLTIFYQKINLELYFINKIQTKTYRTNRLLTINPHTLALTAGGVCVAGGVGLESGVQAEYLKLLHINLNMYNNNNSSGWPLASADGGIGPGRCTQRQLPYSVVNLHVVDCHAFIPRRPIAKNAHSR